MKKLFALFALMAVLPLMASAEGIVMDGSIDINFVMESFNDDTVEPENYYGMTSSNLNMKKELGTDLLGNVKLNLVEPKSDGIDSWGSVGIEEVWVSKVKPFGVEDLGLKVGKMEVPFNLDFDTGITHTMSNELEIDYTWGFNVNYAVAGIGTFNLTTFEGQGGVDAVELTDLDGCILTSMALNWDTGIDVDAFGVAGLRLVIGYASIAAPVDGGDAGTIISLGGTYTLKDLGLVAGLEIDMITNYMSTGTEGAMLIALNADYAVKPEITVGLSYEMANIAEDTDLLIPAMTQSRMALRANYAVAPESGSKVRFEYASTANSEYDDAGGSTISIGFISNI